MDPFTIFKNFPHFILLICFLFYGFNHGSSSSNRLVYQHCESHGNLSPSSSSSSSSSIISTLLEELMEQSNKSKYFATYAAGDDEISILGLFQCRGDLTNNDCYNCVQNLPELSKNLCGTKIPARIQLYGCYIHYQLDEIRTGISRLRLLHKICSKKMGSKKLLEKKNAALEEVLLDHECYYHEGRNGHSCDSIYDSFRVFAECEGNLVGCDCIECVKKAVEIAQSDEECQYSVSGEIYLDSCYLSYGINGGSGSYSDGGLSSKSSSNNKLVAIVIGGIAAAALTLFIFYFCKSWGKE